MNFVEHDFFFFFCSQSFFSPPPMPQIHFGCYIYYFGRKLKLYKTLSLSLFFSSHFYNLSGELLPYPPHAHLSFPHYQSSYLLKMTTKPTGHSCCLTPRNFQVPPNSLETWEKQNQNSSVFSCARYSYFQLLVNVRVTGTLVSPQKRCQRFLSKCEKEGLPWWSSG